MAMIQPYIEDTSKHVYHKTSVDFTLRACSREISIVQYDKDLPIIKVELYSEKEPYVLPLDCSISVRYGKVDGTSIYKYVLGCNPERTAIYFEVDEQMSSIPGFASAIIEMMIDGERVQSSPIQFSILKNPVQNNSIKSHDSYPIIYQLEASVLGHDVELSDHEARITALEEGDIPLDNYYTKSETDTLLFLKQDRSERKTVINSQSTNDEYPTSLAVKNYVDNYGGKIDSISIGGVPQIITNKNVNLPEYYTKLQSDDRYQPKDADLTTIAGLTGTNGFLKKTAVNTWALITLATVATSGDYNDLINKPTIPVVDYPVTNVTVNGTSVILNKVAVISAVTKLGNRTGDITIANLQSDLGLGSLAYKNNLQALDIPTLDTSKITSGTFSDSFIASASTWNAKQDALTFDNTPTENSTNPVTSGGIYTAIINAVTGVYKPQGNATVVNLNAMTKTQSMSGYVYNMVSAGTINNYDGSTESVMIGDNVVLIWNDGDWYWDKLGGMVDLSNYVTLSTDQTVSNKILETKAVYPIATDMYDLGSFASRYNNIIGRILRSDYAHINEYISVPSINVTNGGSIESFDEDGEYYNGIHFAVDSSNTYGLDIYSGRSINFDVPNGSVYINDEEIGLVIPIDDISSSN